MFLTILNCCTHRLNHLLRELLWEPQTFRDGILLGVDGDNLDGVAGGPSLNLPSNDHHPRHFNFNDRLFVIIKIVSYKSYSWLLNQSMHSYRYNLKKRNVQNGSKRIPFLPLFPA